MTSPCGIGEPTVSRMASIMMVNTIPVNPAQRSWMLKIWFFSAQFGSWRFFQRLEVWCENTASYGLLDPRKLLSSFWKKWDVILRSQKIQRCCGGHVFFEKKIDTTNQKKGTGTAPRPGGRMSYHWFSLLV